MKLKYIDALRGLAIMGVLMVHCGQYGSNENLPPIIQAFILNGAHGVQLFYIASAFTLFLSLDDKQISEKYPWLNFFARRFFRIAPMYYLGICYYLWQDGFGPRYWLGNAGGITEWNVLSNFFFIHGFNPYWINSLVPGGWSIAVEMLFYCLVPFLFLKIKNTRQAFTFLLITLLIRTVLQFVLNRFPLIESEQLWNHYLYLYLPSQLPIFALGILLYFIVKEDYKISLSPTLIFISFFILIAYFVGIPLLPNHFLFGIAFVVLAVALSKYEFKVFVNPVVVYIGKVSYSMYLAHFAVLFWLDIMGFVDFLEVAGPFHAGVNYGIRLLLVTTISVVISSFFYRTVELPMQRFGKKLIRNVQEQFRVPSHVTGEGELVIFPNSASGQILPGRFVQDKSKIEITNEK